MPRPENSRWSLGDFAQVLAPGDTRTNNWIVVGGQAVNFWAGHYLVSEPALEIFRPFTSKDLDLVGDENDVLELARRSGTKPTRPRKSAASPVIAIFIFETKAGQLVVEVLNGLAHLTRTDVERQAVALSSSILPDVRVLNPIGCLVDKTGNLTRFQQKERQDLHHVKMLLLCTRVFLKESVLAVASQQILPRKCINLLEEVLTITRTRQAMEAAKQYGIDWNQLWPWDALRETKVEQIKRFVAYRLAPAH